MSEGYLTAARTGEAEYVDKKSRFISRVRSVADEAEARAFIEEIRRRHADATHNVWAYTLREGNILRWSDDGEAGGTSGQPTLNVLRTSGLENLCCVTTRYFGGILLGSGGLVRAYSNAARLALQEAGVLRMTPWRQGALRCPYALYDRLCRALTDRGARIEESSFGAEVELSFTVPRGQEELAGGCVRDLSAGSVEVRYGGEVLRGSEEA